MAQNNNNEAAKPSLLKDLAFWTVAAALMLVPVVGFSTYSDTQTNSLRFNFQNENFPFQQRWGGFITAAVLIAIVVAIRAYVVLKPKKEEKHRDSAFDRTLTRMGNSPWSLLVGGFVAVAFPFAALAYLGPRGALLPIDNFGIQIMIYIMLGWGLNIVVGLAGLLDLGYVAFYAVGAYSYALLSFYWHLSFWEVLPISGLLAALWGIMLGFPVLRLRGDYLAIVTLAFGEIIRVVLINWRAFTGGPDGINGINPPSFFGLAFKPTNEFAQYFNLPVSGIYARIFLYFVILALAALTAYVTTRMRKLPVGRAWEALRENEIACRSLGIDTTKTKLAAFATGAMFGGFAGCFFAARQASITPESFNFNESVTVLAIVVLGGSGSLLGVVIASIVLVGGLEMLRQLTFLKAIFGDGFDASLYRGLIFGLAMVIMMLWRPRGLISNRVPTAFLKERKVVSGSLVQEGHG
jgi:branched-chain amino acid transport system permease protein